MLAAALVAGCGNPSATDSETLESRGSYDKLMSLDSLPVAETAPAL